MERVNKFFPFMTAIRTPDVPTLRRLVVYALLTIAWGLFTARMIVNDTWELAAVVIFVVPAVFVLQRYPFLSILIWMICTPFLLHTTSTSSRQVYWVIHRFMPLLTLITVLLPSALGKKALPRLALPEWAMLAYGAVSMSSILLFNPDAQGTAYLFYDRALVPMMLYMIVRFSNPDPRTIRWLVPVALFVLLSQTGIGILSWFAPGILPAKWVDYENHRTIGTMVNTNAYVTTLVFTGFLVLHTGLQSGSRRMRFLAIFVFLITVYGIFISFSRAGWLAGILVLIGLASIYPKFVFKLGAVVLPIFILVSVLFLQSQLAWAGERLFSSDSERSAFSRVPVYAAAVRMFQAKPFLGWGYGNFDRFDRQFQTPPVANVAGDNKDHASHNFFLSMVAEQGLIGILLYLAPLFYWLGLTIREFPKLPREGFWSRKLLVLLWMAVLSHVVVYNFANMRVVFGLGSLWLVLGLIARYTTSYQLEPATLPVVLTASQPVQTRPPKTARQPRARHKTLQRPSPTRLKPSTLRKFWKKGAGAILYRSRGYAAVLRYRNFASSSYAALKSPGLFADVQTYCMFVGHNKSGASMIGSFLDAHPDAIVSDEADALDYVRAGFTRQQIFHILLRQSAREVRKGRVTARRLNPYSYMVDGQWQGRYRKLHVIGDSTAGATTRMLGAHPEYLDRLESGLQNIQLKFIQVIRNPYDPIAAMMVRGGRSFDNAIDLYFSYCDILVNLRKRLGPSRLLSVHYEHVVSDGQARLTEICEFLGLAPDASYLRACTSILHSAPDASRHWVKWKAYHIDRVAAAIDRYDFLRGYTYH